MDIIEKYKTYRKAGMELTHKIIHFCLDRDILMKSARLLGIVHEDILVLDEMEKEILDALLLSYTSLFKVASIFSAENTILLNDILNKKDNIKLTDIALSKTALPGLLMFIRLVPFKDFNITTGICFAFPGGTEEHLLKRYKKLSKKIKSASESIKRFVIFFRLNKTYGIEVRFE